MPMRLDIKRKLLSRSDRVKSLDLHPTEPWICAALYNGNVHIWNIEAQQLIKTVEVCTNPVRAVKFVARKNWIVTGSDDMQLRVFNYNTLERIQQIEAHSDYIRSIAVHPTQPFILTCSDDMLIRLWDWENNWTCAQVFEGHNHYVMSLAFNPKDNNTFASASLDHTVKVWNLGSGTPNFTLEGHDRGVNCVDYSTSGDKPYLASGSDDRTVKIWDYQTKACVQTLEGHAQNISSVLFHPELPIILTGSEDGTVRFWHANTYRLESTLNYGLERVWTMTCQRGKQIVGIGYDEGTIAISLGRDEPAMSMDASGKLDGERLPIAFKEMGTSDIYPQTIEHNANGRYVVVYGDGEYIVYTAMALRNKTFGQGLEFVWCQSDAGVYAVRESNAVIKVYKQMKEIRTFKLDYGAEQIFGGHLLGVRSLTGLTFYDWLTGRIIRRIDNCPKGVYWSESNQLVALCTNDAFFILRYSADAVPDSSNSSVNNNYEDTDGYEKAFQLVPNGEVNIQVLNGRWFGDAFIFTTQTNRLCYFVGGEVVTLALLDRPMYLLGYLAKENRLFLGDRDLQIVSYTLLLSVLEYETAVLRGDFTSADAILPNIPKDQYIKIAQFLEKQGFRKQAMLVTTDMDHKFELALQLGDFELCQQIAMDGDPKTNENKWKQLAEAACKVCKFKYAEEYLSHTEDYASLMLLATSSGNRKLLEWIGKEAAIKSNDNIAFLARFLVADLEGCLELLTNAKRFPEAAFFARTYLPSYMPEIVEEWRNWLDKSNKASAKIANSLANPKDYPNLFPDLEEALSTEKWLKADRKARLNLPASAYPTQVLPGDRDLHIEMQNEPVPMVEPSLLNKMSHLGLTPTTMDNVSAVTEHQQQPRSNSPSVDQELQFRNNENDSGDSELDSVKLIGDEEEEEEEDENDDVEDVQEDLEAEHEESWYDDDDDEDDDEVNNQLRSGTKTALNGKGK
ncbi:Coatomer subunit beta' [Schistosoma japonicum]|nr:Coatomer subunit beta' [Schistosoma japonicum]KAH8856498.1 Coatomer subunit beta' [Schistosoma japonicum]